jgi:preprotein translocase subunit SecD
MKNIILIPFFMLILFGSSFSQNKTISDGFYLVTKIDTVATQLSTLSSNEIVISFSKLFEEYNSDEFRRIIIDTTEFVPLELEKSPSTEQQPLVAGSTENKKKLLLTLTKEAGEKLKTFTAKHLMSKVVIVVDGEALTMHKIREAITGGQVQITRCNDNACEILYVKLKDNVKK